MKDNLIYWSIHPIFSNDILFLSFHIIQNKYKGATFNPFFCLFPTKEPSELKRASLNEDHITQNTPNKDKSTATRLLLLSTEVVSSSPQHIYIHSEISIPSFWRGLMSRLSLKMFPWKEANPHQCLWVPNCACVERLYSSRKQKGLERSNWESTTLWFQLNHSILLISSYRLCLQSPKESLHSIKLPIIDLSWNSKSTLPPPTPTHLPPVHLCQWL